MLVPLTVRLAERHLSNASDKNELDRAFEQSLARNPKVDRKLLEKLVQAYRATPANVKAARFADLTPGRGDRAAVTADDVRKALGVQNATADKGQASKPLPADKPDRGKVVPVISSITPPNVQPGQWLFNNGANLAPGTNPRVVMTSMDTYVPDQRSVSPTSTGNTQWKVRIPTNIIAGQWAIQVRGANGTSDAKTYLIKTPQYRVIFNQMHCVDESNPEWWGSDELVTFWGIGADLDVWVKNSKEYTGFDDGDKKAYDATDRNVLKPDGQWCPAKYGLGIVTDLHEWDAGDVEAAQYVLGLVSDVAETIGAAVGGTYGAILQGAADVADAISWIIGIFGGDPDMPLDDNDGGGQQDDNSGGGGDQSAGDWGDWDQVNPRLKIRVEEPTQKAVIAWNQKEQIMVLCTELKASRKGKLMEIMPVPSRPKVTKGDPELFSKTMDLYRSKQGQPRGSGPRKPAVPRAGGEILEVVRIGYHKIAVARVVNPREFADWANDYVKREVGARARPALTKTGKQVIAQYLQDGYKYWIFDLIDLSPTLQPHVANLVLLAYDEYLYSHVYLRQEGATNPSLPSGAGAHANDPPKNVK